MSLDAPSGLEACMPRTIRLKRTKWRDLQLFLNLYVYTINLKLFNLNDGSLGYQSCSLESNRDVNDFGFQLQNQYLRPALCLVGFKI